MPDVCPIGTEIQTLLFPKEKFSAGSAIGWTRRHGFKAQKIDTKPNQFHIRQESPERYEAGSFRTIALGDSGVQAVIGCPKQGEGHVARKKRRGKKSPHRRSKKAGKRRATRRRKKSAPMSAEMKHRLDKALGR
jgi:hypothetical protein